MSTRTIEQVRQDYANACAGLGECEYRIYQLRRESKKFSERIRSLDKEAAPLIEKLKQAPPQQAVAPGVEQVALPS